MNQKKYTDALRKATKTLHEKARELAKMNDTAFFFGDEFGRVIKEYPDGRRFEVIKGIDGEKEIPLR